MQIVVVLYRGTWMDGVLCRAKSFTPHSSYYRPLKLVKPYRWVIQQDVPPASLAGLFVDTIIKKTAARLTNFKHSIEITNVLVTVHSPKRCLSLAAKVRIQRFLDCIDDVDESYWQSLIDKYQASLWLVAIRYLIPTRTCYSHISFVQDYRWWKQFV